MKLERKSTHFREQNWLPTLFLLPGAIILLFRLLLTFFSFEYDLSSLSDVYNTVRQTLTPIPHKCLPYYKKIKENCRIISKLYFILRKFKGIKAKVRWASGLVLGVGSIAPLVRFPWRGVLYAMLSVSAQAGPGLRGIKAEGPNPSWLTKKKNLKELTKRW